MITLKQLKYAVDELLKEDNANSEVMRVDPKYKETWKPGALIPERELIEIYIRLEPVKPDKTHLGLHPVALIENNVVSIDLG